MDHLPADSLLVTVTGQDRPGVTATVLSTLAAAGVEVIDVEQIVLRQRLVLGVLITAPADPAELRGQVHAVADRLSLNCYVEPGSGDRSARDQRRAHVTVIGAPLPAAALASLTASIAGRGGNIDKMERMARYPVTAIELSVSGVDPLELRTALAAESARLGVDVAVQPAGLLRRGTRLVVMDVDSTLVQGEVIEMLAAHAGCAEEVAAVTEAAMRGELDFEASLRSRVRLLAGVPASALDDVYASLELARGARTMVRTLKRLGYRFAIVSGGFSQITDRLALDLGIDYARANELEIVAGRLTGRIVGPVVDRAGKATALREFAASARVPLAAVIAIGDGANDLDMLAAAGLGIAYNAKPLVRQAAHTSVNVPYLDAIVYLLGISREEVEFADATDAPSRRDVGLPR